MFKRIRQMAPPTDSGKPAIFMMTSAHNNEPSNVSREQFLLLTYFLGVFNKYSLIIY